MRIELPKAVERFGVVQFGDLQKVFELDSGMEYQPTNGRGAGIEQIPLQRLSEIQEQMAVIVPVKNERLKLIEGVLTGIPHPCLIIVVSNSDRHPIDRYTMERSALRDFCRFVGKRAIIVHQKDKALAGAFREVDYASILNDQGEMIPDGKAEGMIVGTVMAWLAGRKYIGFVDADNYFPGAVEEYIREYAAGFALSNSPYTMVRIAWHSKPKIVESKLFFRKWGRSSRNTNRLLNRLIAHYTGYETEIIKTGNAGEHAMTMELALKLDYSSGYSIEPNHIINMLEKFGGVVKSPHPEVMRSQVECYQIESRNPHLHEAGGEEHIDDMRRVAMEVIFHSSLCPDSLREEILAEMVEEGLLDAGEEPGEPRRFPALGGIDRSTFLESLQKTPYGRVLSQEIGDH